MACFMRPPSPAALASGVDMIYVNHKTWRGDLTSVQLSSRTSPGRRASIYKQWYIHVSVTCFIYTARAGLLPHKWNIIPPPCAFHFSISSVFSFMRCPRCRWACRQLSPTPAWGEGKGEGYVRCRFQGSVETNERRSPAGRLPKPAVGLQAVPRFPRVGGERAGPPALTTGLAVATQPFVTAEAPAFADGAPAHHILRLLCRCRWDAGSWETLLLALLWWGQPRISRAIMKLLRHLDMAEPAGIF